MDSPFEFSLDTLGGFSYTRLVLASILGLFLELLMIRWMSSEVRIFAFLKNYMLVSCFLGLGIGCFLCRKRINLIALVAPLQPLRSPSLLRDRLLPQHCFVRRSSQSHISVTALIGTISNRPALRTVSIGLLDGKFQRGKLTV